MPIFDIDYILTLGRNDKCWCGSGLKFKRCHLDRANEKSLSKGDIIEFEKIISKREKCYAPTKLTIDCDKIIKSHTVSKSSGLLDIADSTHHVLGLKQNLVSFQKNKGKLRFEKIGINKASIFKGFCKKHDNLLFSCFEDKDSPFLGTKEQCIALAYRSVAKEIYAKESALEYAIFMRKNADRGLPLFFQIEKQETIYAYSLGLEVGISELYKLKSSLDIELLNNSRKSCSFLVLESSSTFPIVVSSITNPTHDFNGHFLQSLSDLYKPAEQLVFNAFNSNGKGFLVFSWLKEATIIKSFIDSLREKFTNKNLSYLVNFLFSSAENIFISPDWWSTLSSIQKQRIEELFAIGSNYYEESPKDVLSDNSVTFMGLELEKIYYVE